MVGKRFGLVVLVVLSLLWLNGCGGKSKSVSVSVSASAATVDGTDAVTLTATVTNDQNSDGVTWSLSGAGTLSNQSATSVTYTAPAATSSSQTATITATSKAESSETASATITVAAQPSITTTGTDLAAAVGATYNVQLQGSGGVSPYTWAVTGGALPPCLTMSTSGLITGTVTAGCAGTYNVTFTMTDSGSPNKLTATTQVTITIAAATPITFTGTMPATATFGTAYTGSAAATGGAGTLTYSLASGALPAGLALNPASGAVTGTPTAGGTFDFSIMAADAFGDSASDGYQIVVSYPTLSVTSPATLPAGYVGAAYSQTLTASGGSGSGYTWTVTSGASQLATVGLTLSSGGVLSGATPVQGTATFGVQVKDSASNTGTATLSVTIDAGVSITTGLTLPVGYGGTAYSQTFAATGGSGTGYTWTVSAGANQLTAVGLSLSSAGVLSGTTPVAGAATFAVKVTDSVGNSANGNFAVTIDPGLAITTPSPLQIGYAGVQYSVAIGTSGGTGTGITFSVTAGASQLAAVGLSLSNGAIMGAAPTAGTANFTLQAKDSAGNLATKNFAVTINAGLTITTTSPLPNGYVGSPYGDTFTATGGSGSGYAWSVTSGATALSAIGLSLNGSGVLSGTTPSVGSASFGVQVVDSAQNTANATFTVTVDSGITITTATTLPSGYSGTAYSETLAAQGGSSSGYTWTVTTGASQLTTVGLSLSSGGVLTGSSPVAGTATFTVQVKDSANNTATATFNVTINAGISITTTSPLTVGYAGVAYSQQFAATGGSGSGQVWSVSAGASQLSAVGLTLSGGGLLSGTTPVAGTANFTVQVKDSANNVASGNFSVTVNAALKVTTTSPLPNGFAGSAYSEALAASGGSGSGYTWSVTSGATQLSAVGLSMSSGGVVSGSSPTLGSATFGVQVKDSANNTATASFTVTIGNGLTITNSNPLPAGYVGTAYSDTLTAQGGSGSGYTWSVTAGASQLTTVGLSLSSGGALTGATPVAGTATFTAQVKDSASNTATATFNVTINAGLAITTTSPLPTGYVRANYQDQFTASGGSGSGQVWSVTSGASNLSGLGLSLSSTGGLTGTGSSLTAGTVSFGVQVKDSANNVATGTFQVSIDPGLLITSPATLPGATTGVAYTYDFTTSGGTGAGLTWTVTSNASQLTNIGLSLSGGGVLSGSSPTAGSASFGVEVQDNGGNTATGTFSVSVSTGSTISGSVTLVNTCGPTNPLPSFTVSINTTPVQTTSTDSNGNFSFSSIPNGNYTLTPSITGPSSVFYPAKITGVTAAGGSIGPENFEAEVGYQVTGTINYTGSATGPIYISLENVNCSGFGGTGTTIDSAGNFTINGVAPGTYSISAWMDTIGQGVQNANDPSGTGGANVVVSDANSGSNFDTLIAPSAPTLSTTSGPSLGTVSPTNDGVAISYQPVSNTSGTEEATSYTVEWSTSSSFPAGSTSSQNFIAIGSNADVWILNNTVTGSGTSFANGTSYYFRARGNDGSTNVTPWVVLGGSTPTSVKIGANSTGSTVSGTVTIPSGITIKAGAPLYVGVFTQTSNGSTVYATEITSPVVGANNFSLTAPSGSYQLFAVLDQNNDGLIDVGDVTNVRTNNGPLPITLAGSNLTGQDFSLPAADSTATVQTQYQTFEQNGQPTSVYYLGFQVRQSNKLPIAVELSSGPNLALPVNVSNICQGCGNETFNYTAELPPGLVPTTSQSYSLNVTYSDNTTGTITVPITGVLGSAQLVTLISPINSSSTNQPSFNWSYPANASNYSYQFQLCCNGNNNIWQIPNNNSNANSFSNTQVTPPLAWGVDPTDSSNMPNVSNLTDGGSYNWQIQTDDSNGNSATASANFVAVPSALSLPAPNPSSLPSATVGNNYNGSITVSGGVPPYFWTVGGLSDGLGSSSGGTNNNTLFIQGTPGTATTVSFQVSVTDSNSDNAGPDTYTITVNPGSSVSLPAASTNPLGPGVVSYVYGSGLQASGGSGNYTFVVNGTTIANGSYTAVSNSDGLLFVNSGNGVLMVGGTPTSPTTVSLRVEVIDSNNTGDNTTVTYSVPVTSGPSGVNDANLKGTYTCLAHGYIDADGSKWGSISNVVLDGNGDITSGVFDSNGADFTAENQGTSTGTYSLGPDNNGLATVSSTVTSGGTGTTTGIWALSATGSTSPANEFRMVIVNDTSTAPSGIHGQADCMLDTTSAFTSSTISGKNFIFDLTGADSGGRLHVTAGRFDASAGAVTTGYIDAAKGGNTTMSSQSLTGGSYTSPSSTTGRYTLTITSSNGSLTFAVYIVNSSKAFLISTVSGDGIEEGHVFTQALSSFSNANLSGNAVAYIQGYEFTNSGSPDTANGSYSEVYEATGNGSGGITINQSYMDDTGSYSAGNANGSTTVTFDATNPGRLTINTGAGSTTVVYLADTNAGVEIGVGGGSNPIESGFFEDQTQATFSDAALAGNYMLGMLPALAASEIDGVAEFDVTSSGTITGGVSQGGQGVFTYDQALNFTYNFDSSAPNTGTFLVPATDSGLEDGASCAVISSTRAACTSQTDPNGAIYIVQK